MTYEGDPATPEGISHIDADKQAGPRGREGTPWRVLIHLAGTAATFQGHFKTAPPTTSDRRNSRAELDLLIMTITPKPGCGVRARWRCRWALLLACPSVQHLLGIQLY